MMDGLRKSPLPSSQRLLYERLQACDARAFFSYRSHPDVTLWQPWAPEGLTEARAFIHENNKVAMGTPGEWVQLGLFRRDGGQLIGDCGIHFLHKQPSQVEIGITIAPQYQRQGYGGECVQALLQFTFEELRKHRLIASVDPDNTASVAMMRSAGMRQEAHHVRSFWFRGRWADDLVFAMLAEEWRERQN